MPVEIVGWVVCCIRQSQWAYWQADFMYSRPTTVGYPRRIQEGLMSRSLAG